MGIPSRDRSRRAAITFFEILENRVLLSAAFDITGLSALRSNPNFSQINGSGVGIAVLDTGVFAQNPDLNSNVVAFYNAVSNPVNTPNVSVGAAFDNQGHGSHVSGIAASSNPAIGVAYGAKLVDIHVLPDPGEAQLGGDPVLRGLDWVANNYQKYNIKVINMSIGTPGVNDNTITAGDLQDAETSEIHTLEALGITVVSASGNSYANTPTPGASFPAVVSTISVANTWATAGQASDFGVPFGEQGDQFYAVDTSATPDTFASTSQRSTLPNQVAAPGEDIYSTWNGTIDSSNGTDLLHNTISGTSMATPFVSGLVALMQQAAKTFSGHYITDPNEILQIIQQTSDTVVDSNNPNNARYDSSTGVTSNLPETGLSFKRVDVLKAIERVQQVVTNGNPNIGPAPGPDTDNTTTTATAVPALDGTSVFNFGGSIGTDGQVIVGANDVDLYKLNVTSPGVLNVTLAAQAGGTNFAAVLRLFDASGNLVATITGTSSAYPVLVSGAGPLAVGTYYLGVSGAGNTGYTINGTNAGGGISQGDYAITFELQNPDPNGVVQGAFGVDLTQPNETLLDPVTNAPYTDVIESGLLGSDPPPIGGTTRITVPSDVDMYKMTAPDSGALYITTDTTFYSNPADTYLKVFDANLNVIGSNDNANISTTDSSVTINVTSGDTIYVAVTVPPNAGLNPSDPYQGRTPNATPTDVAYDLHLRFDNGDINGTAPTATPADVNTTLSDAIGSDNGIALVGANNGAKDVDFYNYTVPADGLLDLTATPTTPGFTPVVSIWEYTAGQTDIIKVADSVNLSSPELIRQVTAGESLFVSVTGLGNNNFNWYAIASGTGGQTGSYSLSSTLRPLSDLATLSDNTIVGGAPEPISVGQTVKGNIGMDGSLVVGPTDIDLYKLVAPATETIDIRTLTNQENSADTVLRVFDASGNQLASNDNIDATTTASEVKVSVQAGQTYYIGVSGAGPSSLSYNPLNGAGAGAGSSGNYGLQVNVAVQGFGVSSPAPVAAYVGGTVDFTVTLTQPLPTASTIDYTTSDGTALAGTDYTATSGTLTFAPGVTSQVIHVPLLPTSAASGTRTFTLTLANSQGAPISSPSATGTIQDAPVTTMTFSEGTVAKYKDSLGRNVALVLTGPGTGTAVFVSGAKDPARIALNGTTGASVLTIRTPNAVVDDIVVNGSLLALVAKSTALMGGITVSGSLEKLMLGDISGGDSGGSISMGAAAAPMVINLGHVSNESLSTPGAIASLTVDDWLNSGGGLVKVSAATISALRSSGNFGASISAGSIGQATVNGSLVGGLWSITGSGRNISVSGAAQPAWGATFGGDLLNVHFGSEAGALTARSIRSLKVDKNLSAATIRLTGTTGMTLHDLTVGGAVTSTQIRSAGNIGDVLVGSFISSDLFAGVNDATTTLPAASSAFTAPDSILSFSIEGNPSTFAFANSDIAAFSIGSVSLAKVNPFNGGVAFGVAAKSIGRFANRGVLNWNNKKPASLLTADGDLLVRLLT
ncbi:MAG TPA: S8 family serine peptidase [Tepidisphaeraceae bacterium]|nr:S8 family serine peptidase [Tepidisphaeraceae bacterium]